ncbi:uncharacterized protein LOC128196779 [Vigna angularis]|uniref:uncharacterized protein LOC128196779 n=1 Tax=Phaseolus angularis TaxID=3914 RepID=UPI0022B3EC94|nr:uncharacterized protein LOC128196779 [Vigna angularis]XP_052734360.1 uncharacterized protein LOC128196779 [Vigna angularis]
MEGRIDGRLNVVEGQPEAMEIDVDGMKAETAVLHQDSVVIRQDLQEVMRILGGRNRDQEGQSNGSQASVNANGRARQEEDDGGREVERPEGQYSWRKRVELAAFEGLDPLNWINHAEKFFKLQGMAEDEKVRLAYISMEESAGYWFRTWKEKAKNRPWEGLKGAMVVRFGGKNRGTICERLAAIKQSGTVEEYNQDFETLVGQTKGVAEE